MHHHVEVVVSRSRLDKIIRIHRRIMSTIIHDPENKFKIESVWVFISEDEKGEGVCGVAMGKDMPMMPLIAADEKRLASLKPIAAEISKHTKKKVKLIRLTTRIEEDWTP